MAITYTTGTSGLIDKGAEGGSFNTGATGEYAVASSAAADAKAAQTAAELAETNAAADLVLTNADVVLTHADVVLTHADLVLTNADVVSAEADKVQTGLDRVATAADLTLTNADVVSAEADKVQTGLDRSAVAVDLAATHQDTLDTAADLVLTNADVVLTHADVVLAEADKVQTGLDRVATNADVVLTHADVVSAEADKVQTGLDRVATAADKVATNADVVTTNADASTSTTQAGIATTKAGEAATSASNAASSSSTTNAAVTSFQGQYVSQATAPGSPSTGDLWFDTSTNIMKVFGGVSWANAGSSVNGVEASEEYTATAAQTTFSATYDVGYLEVYLNGIRLDASDYTATNGTSVVLDSGATVGDTVFIHSFATFALADHYNKVDADSRYAQTVNHYTKTAADARFEPIDSAYTKSEANARYEPIDTAYTKAESDANLAALVDSSPATLDTLNELAAALGDDPNYATTTATAIGTKLPKAGGTMTGDTLHGDGVKAKFGTGGDLELYHDGSNSVITDVGVGNLEIRAANIRIKNPSQTKSYLNGNDGGAVTIFHDGAQKLATTATGIDVTGTVTADTLVINNNNATNELTFTGTDYTNVYSSSTSGFQLGTTNAADLNFMTGGVERMKITAGGSVFHKEISHNGDYTSYIGSVSNNGTGNRYCHIQLTSMGGAMAWVEVVGYDYGGRNIYGNGGGYLYPTGNNQAYSRAISGHLVEIWQNNARNQLELVVDLRSGGTSNRWGSMVLRGGTDTINTSQPMSVVQYSFTSSTSRVYS